jgi:hypothetical protein
MKPSHSVYLVREARTDAEPSRWLTIGALWPTKDGKGFSGPVRLAAPTLIPSDGLRIVILKTDAEEGAPAEGAGAPPMDGDIPF